jgi:hypothetical protein
MTPPLEIGGATLVTKKSLELSLSPPRCPPHGTMHRSLLVGLDPILNSPYAAHHHHDDQSDNHEQEKGTAAHSAYNHHQGLRDRLAHLLQSQHLEMPKNIRSIPHPHLDAGPRLPDQMTRHLGATLPLSWQNAGRDSGMFRSIFDTLVTASMPLAAIGNPSAALQFFRLTRNLKRIRYGVHDTNFIDLIFPDNCPPTEWTGLVFFVHGGAWGSGQPWFYRLVATPFLTLNLVVAIVGYRVYPDGNVTTQVHDLECAALELSKRYPDLCCQRSIGTCVVGHSSGAHIALLMVVEQAKKRLLFQNTKQSQSRLLVKSQATTTKVAAMPRVEFPMIDLFIGMSGPYDISHHFDYEAGRGVEEISPMKPSCGSTREQFRLHSPAWKMRDILTKFEESATLSLDRFLPKMALLHGIHDDTVPFTATSEAARIMRSCGVKQIDEIYLPETGHQDAVVQLMLGGCTSNAVVEWLSKTRSLTSVTIRRSKL